jgi:hypothetical protein
MGATGYKRRVVAWIASFAVLLASLAPSLSHALVAAGLSAGAASMSQPLPIAGQPRSMAHDGAMSHSHHGDAHHAGHADSSAALPPGAEGQLSHSTGPNGSHGSHAPELHFEHCPFCFTHAGSFGVPPTPPLMLPVALGSPAMPSLFYQSPAPLQVWATAQSRAPPAKS